MAQAGKTSGIAFGRNVFWAPFSHYKKGAA